LRRPRVAAIIALMDEPVIHRDEVIGLRFNVANVVDLLTRLVEDDGEEDDES